jgi:ankyrin repeat protein
MEETARKEFGELMEFDVWEPDESIAAFQDNQERFKEIIKAYPHFAREKWGYEDEKWYPLYQVAACSSSLSVVNAVFDAYPEAVKEKDKYGETPLHLASYFNQSEHVIQWLIKKFPETAKMKDSYGWTPLHLACESHQSEQVIRLLLELDPEAVKEKDKYGFMPLHLACQNNQSEQVIRMLTQEAWRAIQNSGIDDDNEMVFNTLAECCGFWEPSFRLDHMRIMLEEVPISFDTMNANDTKLCLDHMFSKQFVNHGGYLDKLNFIMMRLTTGVTRQEEPSDNNTFPILHSVLKLLCKVGIRQDPYTSQTIVSILNLVRQRSPDQFRTRDESGSLPLHIAVQLPFMSIVTATTSSDGESTGEPVTNDQTRAIIKVLLEEYPEAAGIADGQGRLPLHIAMEHGQPCADLLLDAEPRALDTRCMVTHMYPFQLAALVLEDSENEMHLVPRNDKQREAISTLYTLLRKTPHFLRQYLVASDSASAGNASQVVDDNDRIGN